MPALVPKDDPKEYATCQYDGCDHILGNESRLLGYRTCHEHRICSICGEIMSSAEIKWLHEDYLVRVSKDSSESMDLTHPRCIVASSRSFISDPTFSIKQSEYDFLNLCRLMIEPSMELSLVTNENNAMIQSHKLVQNWDFDKCYAHLKMLEACVAQVSIALAQNKTELKKRADQREKETAKVKKLEAQTSSRPTNTPATDSKEQALGLFMENFGFKSRKIGMEQWKLREKSVRSFVGCGMTEIAARTAVDRILHDNIAKGSVKLSD